MSSSSSWYSVRVSSTNSFADDDAVASGIEPQLAEREAALTVAVRTGAAQQGTDPRLQLVNVERLDEVVVGARVEAVDPIRDGVAGRQHEHRDPVALATQQATHLKAVDVRQPDVKHDRVGDGARDLAERAGPAVGEPDLVAGELKRTAEHVAQRPVIVDNEKSHAVIVACTQAVWRVSYEPPTRRGRAAPRRGSR